MGPDTYLTTFADVFWASSGGADSLVQLTIVKIMGIALALIPTIVFLAGLIRGGLGQVSLVTVVGGSMD